jgi:hypothetical protein
MVDKLRDFLRKKFRSFRKTPEEEATEENNSTSSSSNEHGETSVAAFNHALSDEFNDLFLFACTTLSGENVAFLRLVQRWKEASSIFGVPASTDLRRQLFNVAVKMYYDFIDPATAQVVGLNVEFRVTNLLKKILGDAAQTISFSLQTAGAEHGDIAPFTDENIAAERMAGYHAMLRVVWEYIKDDAPSIIPAEIGGGNGDNNQASTHVHVMYAERPADSAVSLAQYYPENNNIIALPDMHAQTEMTASGRPTSIMHMQTGVATSVVIPDNFDINIFHDVETSVYMTVLRDTFPRYVKWKMEQGKEAPVVSEQSKGKEVLSKVKSRFSKK